MKNIELNDLDFEFNGITVESDLNDNSSIEFRDIENIKIGKIERRFTSPMGENCVQCQVAFDCYGFEVTGKETSFNMFNNKKNISVKIEYLTNEDLKEFINLS